MLRNGLSQRCPRPAAAYRSLTVVTVGCGTPGRRSALHPVACTASRWCHVGGGGAYIGWFGRWRRLSKDYEYLTATSENAIYLAMSLILTRRTAKATT